MAEDQGFLSRWARRKAQVRRGEGVDAPAPAVPGTLPDATLPDATLIASADPAAASVPAEHVAALSPDHRGVAAAPTSDRPRSADAPAAAVEPLPTMEDVARLTPASDFRRFVAPGVDEGVKRAAMKALFADPHFNIMDGLDIYIDDYGKPDPIPASMLRQMVQSHALGLFDDEKEKEVPAQASPDGTAVADMRQSDMSSRADVEHAEEDAPVSAEPVAPEVDENPDLRLQQDHAARRGGPDEGAGPAGV